MASNSHPPHENSSEKQCVETTCFGTLCIDAPFPEEVQDLIAYAKRSGEEGGDILVEKAYALAASAHAGQVRLSGEAYVSHPLSVAGILMDHGFDVHAIIAGLLHDTVEDTDVTLESVKTEFGDQVADIVNGVTKISMMSFESKEEQQAENIRKMIFAMSQDIRVPVVKLADRVHNMRTLDFQKAHKQARIAKETMDIYVPLANRLGLHRMKLELEDLSFRYLYPDIYAHITEWLNDNKVVERQLVTKIIARIEGVLSKNGVSGTVWGRIKNPYSIYKKMQEQGLTLENMHDILAFRVIVTSLHDCYGTLGLVHAEWKPVSGRIKDYISMPKANGYQSLHTTVIGPEGERIEIQIRTEDMHRLAEHGVASHWMYKEKGHALDVKNAPQFEWLRDIVERQGDESDSKEFLRSLRLDLFKDEVFVFTPAGEVKELPEGACPIDFAYLIHSEVGNHCSGAKINGRLVPLHTRLKSGETCEIITDKKRHPSRDWLKIVKTSKARNRIQHYLRGEERTAAVQMGRDIFEKEARKIHTTINKLEKEGHLEKLTESFFNHSADDFFVDISYGRHNVKSTIRRLQSILNPEVTPSGDADGVDMRLQRRQEATAEAQAKSAILVSGMSDMLVRFAKCCNPVPGDDIIGFTSRGRGLIVHTAICPHVQELEADRLMTVQWDGNQKESRPFPVRIHLFTHNQKGVLAQIGAVLCEKDVNIDNLILTSLVDGRNEMDMTIEVRDTAHLYMVLALLRQLDCVLEVLRKTIRDEI